MTLKERQQQMMAYLKGKPSEIDQHIKDHGAISVDTRLHIYRNAYQVRFWETIDTDHPVLGTYLGDDLFNQMVHDYIDAYPSEFRSLRQFADRLPQFLTEDPTLSVYPHLAELARFERLLLSVFDAPDSERAQRDDLISLPPEQWAGLKLVFHPSVALFQSPFNVVDIWQHIKAERVPPDPADVSEVWVVWRNRDRLTEFVSFEPGEQLMFERFYQGGSFVEVAEELLAEQQTDPSEAMVNTLFLWLDRGWIKSLYTGLKVVK